MVGWLMSAAPRGLTAIFLATTALTSVTGFLFPFTKLMPSHFVGILSLVMLALAAFALYGKSLMGIWRPVYTITSMLSLYLNVFVLIVQAFMKVPSLKAFAPTQTEPAFLTAQGMAFLLFLALTILVTLRYRPLQLAAN
jgi:hypothetical protein